MIKEQVGLSSFGFWSCGEALDSVIIPVVVGSITVQMLGFEICP